MTKKELRQKYKNLRQILSKNEIEKLSLDIANNVLKLDNLPNGRKVWDKTYYHIFLPIKEKNEVDTEYILHLLQGKDKEIIVSKSNFETLEMKHFLLTDNTKIQKNDYNIPEPLNGLEVPISVIDVVFVPLLAFDKNGNRVGYGKGFYDKFLSECKPETIKIGLSFFEPENLILDFYENDIRLDYCVTPTKVYYFV